VLRTQAWDDRKVAVTDGPTTVSGRIGNGIAVIIIGIGFVAASRFMILRVADSRVYFGSYWLPLVVAGVIVGLVLPAAGMLAWRRRQRNLSGVLFSVEGLVCIIGFVYYIRRAVSPSGPATSDRIPLGKAVDLIFAGLTATTVVVATVVMLVLIAAFLRRIVTGRT
jgi:hypothetical protein